MSIYGPNFPDENLHLKHKHKGMLSMANRGRNTNSSQFFLTFDETPWLNGLHTVFGEMVEGEDTLTLLELGGSKKGTPTQDFAISECGIISQQSQKEI